MADLSMVDERDLERGVAAIRCPSLDVGFWRVGRIGRFQCLDLWGV